MLTWLYCLRLDPWIRARRVLNDSLVLAAPVEKSATPFPGGIEARFSDIPPTVAHPERIKARERRQDRSRVLMAPPKVMDGGSDCRNQASPWPCRFCSSSAVLTNASYSFIFASVAASKRITSTGWVLLARRSPHPSSNTTRT